MPWFLHTNVENFLTALVQSLNSHREEAKIDYIGKTLDVLFEIAFDVCWFVIKLRMFIQVRNNT